MKRLKKVKSPKDIPSFKNEDEEAEFYNTHSLSEILDNLEIIDVKVLEKREGKKKTVTIRMDPETIKEAKEISKKLGIKYTTFKRNYKN